MLLKMFNNCSICCAALIVAMLLSAPGAAQTYNGQSLTPIPQPGSWLADGEGEYRSKSEVMREVKRRYDARVLKISLNKKREVYRVRLLLPNGKVRNITVSARR